MAVDRASGYRPSFISAEELSALQPRTSTVRGVQVRDDDTYATHDTRALDDTEHEVLPVGADDEGDTEEQAPVETYLVWLNKLAVLTRAQKPDLKAILAAADELYIPRHTALQDIFDALGITAAGEEDPQIQDWMSMLLRNGGDLDLDTLSNVLEMLRTLADPERKRKATSSKKFEDRVLAEIQSLKDQMSQLMLTLDRMQERTSSAIAGLGGQIDSVAAQMVAWENYRTELQGFSLDVQAAAETDGFDGQDLHDIRVAMEDLRAPGEADNFVSRAEWLAAVAGIVNTRELSLAEQTIATGQLAEQLLASETAGLITIDPKTHSDIVAAQEAGDAAAEQTTVAPADDATPATSV